MLKTSIDLKKFALTLSLVWAMLLQIASGQKAGQECFPEFSDKKTVYDVAGVLDDAQERQLEQKLRNTAIQSSNEIAVVIVPSLCGMEKAQFATELGHEWKIGQAKEDNGIIVLVKPKTAGEKGQFQIAVGRGLEGIIPDATAYAIGQNEMLPSFKQGDIYTGVDKALDVLISLATKEYDSEAYANRYKKGGRSGKTGFGFIGLILCVVIIVILFKVRQVRRYALVNDIAFWAAWALFNSRSNTHGGYWSDFSGGGGGGGGGWNSGDNDFGGFGGGGDFGGGGAGGDW
jgi:uncharacterized protein